MANFPKDIPVPNFNPRVVLWAAAVIFALVGLRTTFYQVEADEEGVVLRFGKFTKTVKPGLHFKIPFGVDSVEMVFVTRILKQEFGTGTRGATYEYQYSIDPNEQVAEKTMVTGDLNSALVEWVIQFTIDDPFSYLFKVRNPDDTLRDASESIMREFVGDRTVDEVITVGRAEIEEKAFEKLQEFADKYELGINIAQVQLSNVDPPKEVQPSFNEVNTAQQEKKKLINEANAEYNRIIPKAEGEADQTVLGAEGYATERINEAEGNANRFNAIFTEYQKAPDVTKRRIYLETMAKVIPNLGRKVIIDDDASQVLPLLNLSGPQTP